MTNTQQPENSKRTILHHPRIDKILEEIDSGDRVLDIGCVQHTAEKEQTETHWLHSELYDAAEEVVGLDYLGEEVEKLNERGYDVVCMNAEEFEMERQFDVITAGELIEHLSNPGKFLDRVHQHLEDEGKFILTTPNPWYVRRFFEALLLSDVHVNPEHTCWFDYRTINQILERHNFQVNKFQYSKAPYFKRRFSLESIDATITRSIRKIGFKMLTGHSMVVVAEKA